MTRRTILAAVLCLILGSCTTAMATPEQTPVPPQSTPSSSPPGATSTATAAWPAPVALPSSGRILFTIGRGDTESHPVYLDASGLHVIPNVKDATFDHAIWGPGGSVIFDSERAGGRHVFRMNLDGTGVVQLTHGPASQASATVSPDGTRIVYSTFDDTTDDLGIHIADIDGSNAVALTRPGAPGAKGGADDPTFSPDGRSIAFERISDPDADQAGLFVIGSDGKGLRRLTTDSTKANHPRWSPDGSLILFAQGGYSSAKVQGPLRVVDVRTGALRAVTDAENAGWSFEGSWSPDGRQIVFHYFLDATGITDLRAVNADGSGSHTLWLGPPDVAPNWPSWGP